MSSASRLTNRNINAYSKIGRRLMITIPKRPSVGDDLKELAKWLWKLGFTPTKWSA
jgi:hypothetical protein